MSKYVRRLKTEPIYEPYAVCISWENPKFEEFKEVQVYRDPSLTFVYNPNYLSLLTEVYRGTAEKIYDYSLVEEAVTDFMDIPSYFEQTADEQQKRLQGEKTYKYYIVTIDENGNRFGSENVTVTAITTSYYGTGDKMYNLLPAVYRLEDRNYNYPLKRFLHIIGVHLDFLYSVASMPKMFYNPEECPRELLPYLYANYGLRYSEDVPSVFQRKFMAQYGELLTHKGTEQMLRYMVTELSGGYIASFEELDSEITGLRKYKIQVAVPGGHPIVSEVQEEIIQRYLNEYKPANVEIELVILLVGFASVIIDIDNSLFLKMILKLLHHYSKTEPVYLDGSFTMAGQVYLQGYHYVEQIIDHTVNITVKE